MVKRLLIALPVVAAITAAAFWFGSRFRPAQLVLHQPSPAVGNALPLNQSWTWTCPWPSEAGDNRASLRLHQKRFAASQATQRFEMKRPISRAEADQTFGTGLLIASTVPAERPASATVSLQLLDLSELGIASDKPGQNLRVMATLSIGGVISRLSRDEIYLPGTRIAGYAVKQASQWTAGQLHLFSFTVEDGSDLLEYDVLLEATSEEPSNGSPNGSTSR